MFYEESSIRNVLNCELCNYRLEDEPKLLPCAATVCIRCISSIKTIIDNRFKCPVCSTIHVIPDEGFPTNKALVNILSIRPTEICRSSAVESFKSALTDLLNRIETISVVDIKTTQIKEIFDDSKEEVQYATQILLERIKEFYDEFIRKIGEYEATLKPNMKHNLPTKNELKNAAQEILALHNEWAEYLKYESQIRSDRADNNEHKEVNDEHNIIEINFPNRSLLISSDVDSEQTGEDLSSSILTLEQMSDLMNFCQFNSKRLSLVYKATEDGFGAADFHDKCNGVGHTLVLVQAESGNIFGGYTEADWSGEGYQEDENAFIFSMVNKYMRPLYFHCTLPEYAIYAKKAYGPTFGRFDFCIRDHSNIKRISSTELGDSYRHAQWTIDPISLAGSYHFLTKEIEVYIVD